MKEKVYAEIGIGNETFLSTEVERGKQEVRFPRFILPRKISGVYFRLWIFKKVLIISTNNGIKLGSKDRNKLKILLGISGVRLK